MRSLLAFIPALLFSGLALAEPLHGISMHGTPALPADYKNFPYVNPDVKKGGRVSYGVVGTFDSLNPFVLKGMRTTARGVWDPEFGNLMYEPLMQRSGDEPFSLYGLLAETAEWDDDRTFIQFNLNPKAKWQDGQPVTPEDVMFTFNLLKDKGRPPFNSRLNGVAKMEKIGEHGVRFTFNENANRETPLILASSTPILPKHAIDPDTFEQSGLGKVVGSGPYRIKSLRPGERVIWERNPDYWGKDVPSKVGFDNYDEISILYFLQVTTMFEAFKKGDIDIYPEGDAINGSADTSHWGQAYNFPAVHRGDIARDIFEPRQPSGMFGLVFNTRKAIFANEKVREGLSYALDFEWMNRNIMGGSFKRTQSYYQNSPLGAFGNAADARELALLGDAAKKLPPELLAGTYAMPVTDGSGADRTVLKLAVDTLKQGGYTIKNGKMSDAKGRQLAFEIMTQNPAQERIALAYQRSLRLIGVDMAIRSVDDGQYQARSNSFEYDMIIRSLPSSLSPGAEQLNRWGSASRDANGSFNYAGVADPDVDRMLDALLQARSTEDFQAAVRGYDRLLTAGHYIIPLYHIGAQWVARWKYIARPEMTPMVGNQKQTWWDARAQ
ncbi:extracellular solute-binding protein [Agrobacterium rosae]|uniref:ABC transporter substrate-binding protein n=1 Tax=Agrobacterium rosae TaxID=1972867 RepID=A0AAE5RYU4_9HYPH|nr:extracellular solute-binding protein [Agrobacterium rosae]KAA3512220.1 ABC transporter substrate-binding protein [Agrobacterium rosae]KAA3520332.1 ABC transporter substrate-binding protein [Agrobacterium rosae]MCM2432213.1 ABC transporter substrate-binding protein [Agrobacterium rosae]MDX8327648.1 extracellular solute-binding protein [Agrobacterium rosae]MQB48834.1 ABC transporter substrate-binding protein [Agrobacterium rosae]